MIPTFEIVKVYKLDAKDELYSLHIKLDSGIEIKGLNLKIVTGELPVVYFPSFLGFCPVKKKWVKVPIVSFPQKDMNDVKLHLAARLQIWLMNYKPTLIKELLSVDKVGGQKKKPFNKKPNNGNKKAVVS